jgi:hypothetical protein
LMVFVGVIILASGIIFPWLLIGGVLVCVKGFFGWRDARADASE